MPQHTLLSLDAVIKVDHKLRQVHRLGDKPWKDGEKGLILQKEKT